MSDWRWLQLKPAGHATVFTHSVGQGSIPWMSPRFSYPHPRPFPEVPTTGPLRRFVGDKSRLGEGGGHLPLNSLPPGTCSLFSIRVSRFGVKKFASRHRISDEK